MERSIQVHTTGKPYPIVIQKGLLSLLGEQIRTCYGRTKIFILTDRNVEQRYGITLKQTLKNAGFDLYFFSLEPGEASKNMDNLSKIYDALLSFGMQRDDLLLTFGGGVVGDLGGFAAATFLRGIPYMQIPTSLIAQVDSSVGGKVAVNLPQGKNLAGSFYQPQAVWIDSELLETLTDRTFIDGMAEVIKYSCILDASLFVLLKNCETRAQFMKHSEEIIYRCCSLKSSLVEQDPIDKGLRMLLNFGHTLGHAIEAGSNYQWMHGEAVAAGMLLITEISQRRGMTEPGTYEQLKELLDGWGFKMELHQIDQIKMNAALLHDKKNQRDHLRVVLLKEIGTSFLFETDQTFFSEVLL